jgi:glycosyltransferase involved in cell wall biosynthesis
MSPLRIFIVLPHREVFSQSAFGAIALTVAQYVRHSALREETQVLGTPVNDPKDAGVFYPIPARKRWWRSQTSAFITGCLSHMERHSPQHIDVHNRVSVFHACAKRFPTATVSLWLHNDPLTVRGAVSPAQRRSIIRAGRVICVSDWLRARFLQGLDEAGDKVIVLPEAIESVPAGSTMKQNSVLFVGRIIPEKGADIFVRALAKALPQLPGWRGVLIGGGRGKVIRSPSTYEQQVRADLALLGERVTMAGVLPHERVMEEFSRSAIAIVPSIWDEPFGRTALEAMAAGCAVIATKRGGLAEVVGDAAVKLEPPDGDTLAREIVSLAQDDDRRADLQRRAAARAAQSFDVRDWTLRLDALRAEPRTAF